MILQVFAPRFCPQELTYTLDVVLGDFLGINYALIWHDDSVIRIKSDSDDKHVELPATFFVLAQTHWMSAESMPTLPLARWDSRTLDTDIPLCHPHVPVLYGVPECSVDAQHVVLGLDLLGSMFFMLSRYEEAVTGERDAHDRFPARASVAYKQGFLNRPIVNEYLEILWACLRYLWPSLTRKTREFRKSVSCDVDMPYRSGSTSLLALLKQVGADVVKRRALGAVPLSVGNYVRARSGDYSQDPLYSRVDWLMDANEAAGNIATFYFIAGHTSVKFDGVYHVEEPAIREMLHKIATRGHRIGLHPSYHTYRDRSAVKREADNLRSVLTSVGIKQAGLGCRQHFLRWDARVTPSNLAAAGLDYDSTLGFADHVGFRCGVCYEYLLYDLVQRQPLPIKESPLLVMDGTLFESRYMGIGDVGQAVESVLDIKQACAKFSGNFELLWHNSYFSLPQYESVYKEIIS